MIYCIKEVARVFGLTVLIVLFVSLTIIKDVFFRILKIIFVLSQKVRTNSYIPCNLSLSFVRFFFPVLAIYSVTWFCAIGISDFLLDFG